MSSQQVNPVKDFNDNQPEENFENKSVDKSSHKLSKRDYALMGTYAYINIITGSVYSCLAPFFPKEAELKGLSPAIYGFLFSVQEIIAFILCPVIGVFLPKIGLRLTLLSGSIIASSGVIIFGALAWVPAGNPFAISCGIVRALGSVGMAGLIAGMYATIPIFFPNHVTQVFGLLEMSIGIGMIVGPLLGGVLYEVGGFGLPFYVCGGLMFISFPLIFLLCPESKENANREEEKAGIIDILSNFRIFISIFVTLVTCTVIGFLDVGLEPHLREFAQLRSSTVGVIFLVAGLFYGSTTYLVGLIVPKIKDVTFLNIFGLILSGLAFVFIGPMYPVPINPSIPLVIVCQVLFGIGSSISLVANFSQSMREKDLSDMKDDSGAASIISSLFISIFSLGSAIGPIVGGQLVARYKFGEACTFMVGLITATLLLVVLTIIFHKRPYTIAESTPPRVVVQRLASTQHRNIVKIKEVELNKTAM